MDSKWAAFLAIDCDTDRWGDAKHEIAQNPLSLILGVLLGVSEKNGYVRVVRKVFHTLHRVHDGAAFDCSRAKCERFTFQALPIESVSASSFSANCRRRSISPLHVFQHEVHRGQSL